MISLCMYYVTGSGSVDASEGSDKAEKASNFCRLKPFSVSQAFSVNCAETSFEPSVFARFESDCPRAFELFS